jgi:tetratricopeptide (TPR) repeat protein
LTTHDFDALWERLGEQLGKEAQSFAAESREAPARAAELLALPPRTRARRLHTEPRFHSRALVQELIGRARRELEGASRPQRALPALKAALRILGRLSARSAPAPRIAGVRELKAETLCELGEAWRRLGSPACAESCLAQAAYVLLDSPDAAARALLCARLARLRVDQLRGDEAVALYARAVKLWEEVGDSERSAAARVEQGLALLLVGELEEALETSGKHLVPFGSFPRPAV